MKILLAQIFLELPLCNYWLIIVTSESPIFLLTSHTIKLYRLNLLISVAKRLAYFQWQPNNFPPSIRLIGA